MAFSPANSLRAAARIVPRLANPNSSKRLAPRILRPELTGFTPRHGEQIWVFNHLTTNQVILSHEPAMDSNKALAQLPYLGKKTKPAKLRRDYWRPMALIQFPRGAEVIGRSVFQKLREFRRQHELSWGYQAKELYAMQTYERGRKLADQKANVVADMAAVLGGAGRGNRIWISDETNTTEQAADDAASVPDEALRKLAEATVYWAEERDRFYAKSWSDNVTHEVGLPPRRQVDEPGTTSSEDVEAAPGVVVGNEAAVQQPETTAATTS